MRRFDHQEERAHFLTHFLGLIFILVVGSTLIEKVQGDVWMTRGIWFYALSFAFVFAASSIYHWVTHGHRKAIWRKVDHISIYYFILGSNAPFLLGVLPGMEGVPYFMGMFTLVLIGTAYKISGMRRWPWISLVFYVLLGWLGLVTVWLIFDQLSAYTFTLILIGGLLYTIGVYFYANDHRRWFHTIWHLFVLAAAGAHFAAVSSIV